MLLGFIVKDLKKIPDERGYFAEVIRGDWKDFLGEDRIMQVNMSLSYPGMIKAWHRHKQGQVDYFIVLKGALKVCAYDGREDSETKGQLDEVVISEEILQAVRVPGHYWHGIKAIGSEPTLYLYFVTKLYDYKNPDEERAAWNTPSIRDPRTGAPYDWEKPPHK